MSLGLRGTTLYQNNLTIEEVIEKGKASKTFLENLSFKKAEFKFEGIDIYGRALGVVYFDSKNANKALLKQGGCLIY